MEETKTELQLIKLSEIQSQEVSWLWFPFIPYGKLTIVQGDPGDGKTTFILNIAAKLSMGEGLDGGMNFTEPLNVIYQSAEDGLADTVKPRLEQAKADCEKISVIDEKIKSLSMIDERLEEAVIKTGAKLLILDPIPYTTGSKRGLETRVSLKKALAELGFKGGTRSETERNQWVAAEKEQLAEIMLQHGIEWEKKGTHEKHLSVLDFEKQERQKEVAELEQTISGSREELSDILHQQIAAGQETEQIRKEGEAIRQEVSELTATNHLLKEQKETLTEDKEKLLSENEKLEKQQKKLQQELNKMVQSKEVMERNIHAYDEDVKWQLAEPGALMSAKNYRDKKALPLVEKLKEVVKNLTIKCVQLTEQSRKLTAKVDGQQKQISRLTDKVMEQSDTIDRLQEKVSDLGRLERHLGREQVQSIVERSKVLEQAERAIKRPKRAFEMSR